jgi:hypothetical protein
VTIDRDNGLTIAIALVAILSRPKSFGQAGDNIPRDRAGEAMIGVDANGNKIDLAARARALQQYQLSCRAEHARSS